MAISTNGSGAKYIYWDYPNSVAGLSSRTIETVIYPAAWPSVYYDVFLMWGGAGNDYCVLYFGSSGKIRWLVSCVTTDGVWEANTAMSLNQNNHISLCHTGSSTPTIYINGSLSSVTTVVSPVGAWESGASSYITIGSNSTSMNGVQRKLNVYNRIASASEIADWHASRKFIPSRNGLVFAPRLNGAAGGVKDGDTLGSTNYITDLVSGARGTPSGSPIILADNYLRGE